MLSGNSKKIKRDSLENKINAIDSTSDKLTGRAGLSFFIRYIDNIGINTVIKRFFGSLRKSNKGGKIIDIFKQLYCFFLDGSSRHMTHFDSLKKDEGYAAALEFNQDQLCSSHSIKRFFNSFSYLRNRLFRKLLQKLFIWRLQLQRPDILILDIDTVVMDNDDAQKREGVSPTYKKKKGFQPFLIKWDRYIVDGVFRGGKKHSNNGNTVKHALGHLVGLVRNNYRADIPIIVTCDGGFFDQKLFEFFECELCIHYICSGKLYADDSERVAGFKDADFFFVEKRISANYKSQWKCVEFTNRRKSWKKARRAIYTVHTMESNQRLLLGMERIYYTNLGHSDVLTLRLKEAGYGHYLNADNIVRLAHQRGEAELVHRNIKEFGFQQMPLKHFTGNEAFFYIMVLAFDLYESYKWDVCRDLGVIAMSCRPNTFRRRLLDFAGKIVRHSRTCILKVNAEIRERLKLDRIWELCNRTPDVLLS